MQISCLLSEKDKWKDDAKRALRERLMNKPMSERVGERKEEKLAVLIGEPQVGKTTLLLNLMGVAESGQEELARILRAGRKKGESSTSAAIIYRMSPDGKFGLTERAIADQTAERNTYSRAEFEKQLRAVREKMESGGRSADKVLYIDIPDGYFEKDTRKKHGNINIMDLPGYYGKEEKERQYAKELLVRYSLMAAVNIIVRKAENLATLPEVLDGVNLCGGKYLLVLTEAYTPASIRGFFLEKHSAEEYKNYIKKTYDSELRKAFGGKIPKYYFPVDIGESFRELLKEAKDGKMLKKCREDFLEEIRVEIQRRQGNDLKPWLEEMKADAESSAEEREEKIKNWIGQCNAKKEEWEKENAEIAGRLEKAKAERKELEYEKAMLRKGFASFKLTLLQKNQELGSQPDAKKTIWRENIKNKQIKELDDLQDCVVKDYDNVLGEYVKEIETAVEAASLPAPDDLFGEIEQRYDDGKSSLKWELEKEKEKNPRVFKEMILKNIAGEYEKIFRKYLEEWREDGDPGKKGNQFDNLQKLYLKQQDETGKKIEKIGDQIWRDSHDKEEVQADLESCEEKIESLKHEQEEIAENRKKDKALFDQFHSIMKDCYHSQRQEIIGQINREKDKGNKMGYLLLLCLVWREYRKIAGDTSE